MPDLVSHYHDTALTLAALAIAAGVVLAAVAVRLLLARREAAEPVEPEHVGATERWSPKAQIQAVPRKPLGPEEVQRIAEAHEAAIWEDQQRTHQAAFRDLEVRLPRRIDDTFDGLIRRAQRIGHLELDTCEIPAALMAEVVARGAG